MLLAVTAMEDQGSNTLMDFPRSPKQEPDLESSVNILVETVWKDEEEELPVSFGPLESSPSEDEEFVKKETREVGVLVTGGSRSKSVGGDDGDHGGGGGSRKPTGVRPKKAVSKHAKDANPEPVSGHIGNCLSSQCTRERSSSESDEFNEPDPDSSDEWLPSEVTHGRGSSSRASRADSASPNVFPFTATPGPRNSAAELDSGLPADFLELFLTDELLQHIAQQTNLYAGQYSQSHQDSLPHSRGHAWKPVSVPELKTFFGLTFLTGYIRKPSLEMYWSVDEIDATPYFSQTMSRNRFQIIWRFLHYNDNTSLDVTDKMCKVRPVLNYLVKKFKEMYQPGQNICIDEGMMQWRGRLSFKVYNPQKPVKYGIKSYVLCDSATGYCFNMQPYVDEARTLPEIVFSLLDRLPGNGYTLYMDNFYNSVALCERLQEAQTNVCGTLGKNKGGASECAVAYNSPMNGVNKLDQNVAYYPFIWKSLNWSKKFVAYLFQVSMFNAYILYRARNRECKTLLEFMRQVVKSWTAKPHVLEEEEVKCEGDGDLEEGRPTPRAPYNTDPDSRLDGKLARHKLECLMPSGSKSRPSRRCRVCIRRGKRRETKMWCKSCCVPLHAGECFTAYHTKQNYT